MYVNWDICIILGWLYNETGVLNLEGEGSYYWSKIGKFMRVSLRSEKDRQNIDIYRGFIGKFSLFGNVEKPYSCNKKPKINSVG